MLSEAPKLFFTVHHRLSSGSLIRAGSKEAGCLQYDLHESHAIPDVRDLSQRGKVSFVLIERWKSEDDLRKHVAMPYHDDFLEILDGKLESLNVQRLSKLP
ncbi:TPA: antibiotic biosynthesis monooxygenase [Raoultella ornithinolytica]|nr:antibiotic biosynthesis monooxygenase [Raoultella ornithinolytica]